MATESTIFEMTENNKKNEPTFSKEVAGNDTSAYEEGILPLDKRMNRALLKYVVKSSQQKLLDASNQEKLKAATKHILAMLIITAAFFGLTNNWRFIDSFWFAFVTLTTIGFGDFTPTTPFSRVMFVIISKIGLGSMTLFLAEVIDAANRHRERHRLALRRVQYIENKKKEDMDIQAEKKWNEFDSDGSGHITEKELYFLAKWVLSSFKSSLEEEIEEDAIKEEAKEILKHCDTTGDGALSRSEFIIYYNKIIIDLQHRKSTLHNKYCFGLIIPKTEVARAGIKAVLASLSFAIILIIGGIALHWSEGWIFIDAVYFAFQTSSTIGYGDQSSLYRHWSSISHDLSEPDVSKLWSEITLGTNHSIGEVLPSECTASRGICTVSDDGISCNCTFSDSAKLILAIYFLMSASSLAMLFDAAMTYTEELALRSQKFAKRLSTKIKTEAKRMSQMASMPSGLHRMIGKVNGDNHEVNGATKVVPQTKDYVSKNISKKWHQTLCFRLSGSVLSCSLYMLFGAIAFAEIEPKVFSNYWESFYFCAITLTTIGYGDFTVNSEAGKIFLIFYCIFGIALVSKLLDSLQEEIEDATEARITFIKDRCCCKKTKKHWTDEVSIKEMHV
jgi:Ca2+-binding EF-hand superfamily protein